MNKIVEFGLPRSGTTLVAQVLSGIFPNVKIQKVHEFLKTKAPVVICVRDFRDVMVSRWRVRKDIPLNELDSGRQMTSKEVEEFLSLIGDNIHHLNRMHETYKAVVLKYEEFLDNHDYIFDRLESFFDISVDKDTKLQIKEDISLGKNTERAMKFDSFHNGNWDEKGIHGLHIYKRGRVGIWKALAPEKLHDVINKRMKRHLIKWGYEI